MIKAISTIIVALISLFGGPLAPEPPAAKPTGLKQIKFDVAGGRYSILLPINSSTHLKSALKVRDYTRSMRLQRDMHITPMRGQPIAMQKTTQLKGGGTLHYNLIENAGGGSGGVVSELTGWLRIGTELVAVSCTDQAEGTRDPAWCVAYLHHLTHAGLANLGGESGNGNALRLGAPDAG